MLVKPEDGRKIDLAVAGGVGPYEAAMTMPVLSLLSSSCTERSTVNRDVVTSVVEVVSAGLIVAGAVMLVAAAGLIVAGGFGLLSAWRLSR